jgi:hypothetical protein
MQDPSSSGSDAPGSGTESRVARLGDMLVHARWSRRTYPFPHLVVEQVFVDAVYRQIVAAFLETLPGRPRDKRDTQRMTYHGENFDAYIMPFTPSLHGALSVFISKAWVDLLARATGVNVTNDVNGALHCHATGSRDGFIHKDLSSCWFVDNPRADGVNVSDNAVCNYRTGKTSAAGTVARERVRAVAMIFYLGNALWSVGDGGETGLYRSRHDAVGRPAATVPPVNNSMLVFECTPRSYHSFINNRRNPRSSIALWLHQPKADAVAKWGEHSIVYVK